MSEPVLKTTRAVVALLRALFGRLEPEQPTCTGGAIG
jgi:hypothetical protein